LEGGTDDIYSAHFVQQPNVPPYRDAPSPAPSLSEFFDFDAAGINDETQESRINDWNTDTNLLDGHFTQFGAAHRAHQLLPQAGGQKSASEPFVQSLDQPQLFTQSVFNLETPTIAPQKESNSHISPSLHTQSLPLRPGSSRKDARAPMKWKVTKGATRSIPGCSCFALNPRGQPFLKLSKSLPATASKRICLRCQFQKLSVRTAHV
jgi:hypothetical protein